MTAAEIIQSMRAEGKSAQEIQARLREGLPGEIPIRLAIVSLSLAQEDLLALVIKLFADVLKVVGLEVDVEGMTQAYLEEFRLAQDAFFHDAAHGEATTEATVEDDQFEGQVTLDEAKNY